MSSSMLKTTALIIGSFVAGAGLLYQMHTAYVQSIESALYDSVAAAEVKLSTTAGLVIRNEVDASVQHIVRDCPNDDRTQFEHLLGRIDAELSNDELIELQTFFHQCADFFAMQKQLMSLQLESAFNSFRDTVSTYTKMVESASEDPFRLHLWQSLVSAEQRRSELFNRLVTIQGEIIAALLQGESRDSQLFTDFTTEVAAVRIELDILKTEVANLTTLIAET